MRTATNSKIKQSPPQKQKGKFLKIRNLSTQTSSDYIGSFPAETLSLKDNDLLKKFEHFVSLNKSYEFEHNFNHRFEAKVGLKDRLSTSEQLKMLENKIQINKAQQELQKRERQTHHKNNLRRKKKWKQIGGNMEPYLVVYKNFLENLEQMHESQSSDEDETLDRSQRNANPEIIYSKEIKKYPHIIELTNKKLARRNEYKEARSSDKWKTKSLDETKRYNNPELTEEYQTIYDRSLRIKPKDEPEKTANIGVLLKNKFEKIYEVKSKNRPVLTMKTERCQQFAKKQSRILDRSRNLSKESVDKMSIKFAQILTEIGKNSARKQQSPQKNQHSFRKIEKKTSRVYTERRT